MAEVQAEVQAEWRVILGIWRAHASPQMIDDLLDALDANSRTLYRWIKGPNKPDSRRKILVLEQHVPEIGPSLRKYFPQYYETSQDVVLRAVAPFYARVAHMAAQTEKSLVLRAVTRLVLDNMVKHLDTEQDGVVAMLAQLMSSQNNRVADRLTLHAWSGCGSGIWQDFPVQRSFTVHSSSLCGLAVTTAEEAFYHRDCDFMSHIPPVMNMDRVQSAAAYPLLRAGEVAGVVFVAAIQEKFFTILRREIVGHYISMMDKAFRDQHYFPLSQIDIEVSAHDEYLQFIDQLAQMYPDETHEQISARLMAMFREYSTGIERI